MNVRREPARMALIAAFTATLSCGGGSSPSQPGPSTAPSVAPSTAPSAAPTPSPSAAPDAAAAACDRIGRGNVDHSCDRHFPRHLQAVEDAIERLAAQKPEIFNLTDQASPGAYRVLNAPAYYDGVVEQLGTAGYCAEETNGAVLVKDSQTLSEEYDLLLGTGHVRRGPNAYRESCQPAAFPLSAEELISYVRVHFFSIKCDDGIEIPNNGDDRLPVGCSGFITATPKTKDNLDVPAHLVGTRIDWTFEQDSEVIILHDWPDQDFNKTAVALKPGHWKLCATVKGFEGCQHGEVPAP